MRTHTRIKQFSVLKQTCCRRCCLYRLVQTAQSREMEPTAAMAHTGRGNSSITELTEERRRRVPEDTERRRKGGRGMTGGGGGEMGETESLTSFPGLRPAFLLLEKKQRLAAPAQLCLPACPPVRARRARSYHIHTHGGEQHTHTYTYVQCYAHKKGVEEEKMGEGDDQ